MGDFLCSYRFRPIGSNMERPSSIPKNKIEIQPLKFAGETVASKLERIRKAIAKQQADGILVSALDEIAWTLNLRGNDVHCNPVFVAYLLIETTKATLFIDSEKLTTEVKNYLEKESITIKDYNELLSALQTYNGKALLINSNEMSHKVYNTINSERAVVGISPIPEMKAVKNETEIEGFKHAMVRDGIAMVKFLRWLKPAVKAGKETEISLEKKLTSLRAEQDLFRGICSILLLDTKNTVQLCIMRQHHKPIYL